MGAFQREGVIDSGETFYYNEEGGVTLLDDASYVYAGAYLVSTVPVPAAAWLFGSGLIGLMGIARRKK